MEPAGPCSTPHQSQQPPSQLHISMPAIKAGDSTGSANRSAATGSHTNTSDLSAPMVAAVARSGEDLLADALVSAHGSLVQAGGVLGRAGSTAVLESALMAASVLPQETSAPRELGEGDAGEPCSINYVSCFYWVPAHAMLLACGSCLLWTACASSQYVPSRCLGHSRQHLDEIVIPHIQHLCPIRLMCCCATACGIHLTLLGLCSQHADLLTNWFDPAMTSAPLCLKLSSMTTYRHFLSGAYLFSTPPATS